MERDIVAQEGEPRFRIKPGTDPADLYIYDGIIHVATAYSSEIAEGIIRGLNARTATDGLLATSKAQCDAWQKWFDDPSVETTEALHAAQASLNECVSTLEAPLPSATETELRDAFVKATAALYGAISFIADVSGKMADVGFMEQAQTCLDSASELSKQLTLDLYNRLIAEAPHA